MIEIVLMCPAYDKLCWNTYLKIGSDNYIQYCYRNSEIAKGAWMLLFWFSGIEMSTVFFFENNTRRFVSFLVVAAVYCVGRVMGYQAVSFA